MKGSKEAIQILVFSIIAVIVTVTIAIISGKIFVYGGTLISLFWTIKSTNYLIRHKSN